MLRLRSKSVNTRPTDTAAITATAHDGTFGLTGGVKGSCPVCVTVAGMSSEPMVWLTDSPLTLMPLMLVCGASNACVPLGWARA
jgi:hypothetical protein